MNSNYKAAGVDVTAGYRSNELIKEHVAKTFTPNVIGGLGGFGGMFSVSETKDMREPVLVCGTDGVGTKLKLAFLMEKHDTIGIDCVAMCVNDVICCGAKPLLFLDYYGCGKNYPETVEQVVKGVADGCVMAGASLIGGETAELPGMYPDGEYDMAGFCVGLVDRPDVIDGSKVNVGDVIIGIASSGIHSNGYSLVRKVFDADNKENLEKYYDCLSQTLGECLLTPTKIYVNAIKKATEVGGIKAIANITGGGFYENIPRAYKGFCAEIKKGSWPVLPIFDLIMEKGQIPLDEMFGVLNMGIGMVIIADKNKADGIIEALETAGEKAYVIGEMKPFCGKDIVIC
ncbi:MAG: phosphoribosylformylglycinamidine cyclo-ligase [Clostridiales bacterium]|jgi:phosphoribosylformylglycinamidine cyclo-ligase|nr:phosphoribosylformylglycinamidine cyclo-ligase [Clostridiales bacterium]